MTHRSTMNLTQIPLTALLLAPLAARKAVPKPSCWYVNLEKGRRGTVRQKTLEPLLPTLIEFLSGSTRLAAGTVIPTGTPHGVGGARKPPVFLQPGDSVTIEIDGIGALTNPVTAERDA